MQEYGFKDFTAIDFETASKRFPCQLGLVVVRNREIIKRYCRLIRPPENAYDYRKIKVHGIVPEMTENEPEFPVIWEEIKDYINGQVIVAHNANFDISVLEGILDYYDLPKADIPEYRDTMYIWGNKMKLNKAAACCHVELENHHDALCDAECCAKIYLAMQQPDFCPDYSAEPVEDEEPSHINQQTIKSDLKQKDLNGADESNPFYDQKVVITGLFTIDRNIIAQKLKSLGADVNSSISKKTNFVVMGMAPGPKKLEKIKQLTDEGCSIKCLSEKEAVEVFESYNV